MDFKRLANLLYPDVEHDIEYYEKVFPPRTLAEGAIVSRFAPSPTGNAHMGNIYSAFIDYVFARQTSGILVLRIEDTDQQRQIENGIEGIIADLRNVAIVFDEDPLNGGDYGPYIQTQRQAIYDTFAKHLVSIGLAYPCFCTPEDLKKVKEEQEKNKMRVGYYGIHARCSTLSYEVVDDNIAKGIPWTLRLRSRGDFNHKTILKDLVKGRIEFPENDLDYVLIKSDKIPLYHYAHVIDDHLMRITHVIRDESWLSSYPVHAELFRAFEFNFPHFAHISPLNVKDGESIRKISKRKDPEAAIKFYHQKGIPYDVIKLYLATITNSNFEEWYNQNPQSTISDFQFTFAKTSKSGALFDLEKLYSISRIYFSRMKAEELYEKTKDYLAIYDPEFHAVFTKDPKYSISILNIERNIPKPRKDIISYSDIKAEVEYMYDELFDENYRETVVKDFYTIDLLADYIDNIYDPADDNDTWFEKVKQLCVVYGFSPNTKDYKEHPENYKGSVAGVCELIRVAVTGRAISPDIYEILKILGSERIRTRITMFADVLK